MSAGPLPNPREQPTIDVETAGAAFGVGRSTARKMAKEGTFPVPVIRVGKRVRVSTAAVYEVLSLPIPAEGDLAGYTDQRTA